MPDDLAVLLGKRFLQRRDVKAVQHNNGAYTPDRSPWKMTHLRDHLSGQQTYGHYMLDAGGMTKLFAFDIDLTKEGHYYDMTGDEMSLDPIECNPREAWLTDGHPARPWLTIQLRCMAEALAQKAHSTADPDHIAVAYSGAKGFHVYCFYDEPQPARDLRTLAVDTLKNFNNPDGTPGFIRSRGENFWRSNNGDTRPNIDIEVYPKQDDLDGKDLGNLMRLPLGVNRKSGQVGYFLDLRRGHTEMRMMDPLDALGGLLPWD